MRKMRSGITFLNSNHKCTTSTVGNLVYSLVDPRRRCSDETELYLTDQVRTLPAGHDANAKHIPSKYYKKYGAIPQDPELGSDPAHGPERLSLPTSPSQSGPAAHGEAQSGEADRVGNLVCP